MGYMPDAQQMQQMTKVVDEVKETNYWWIPIVCAVIGAVAILLPIYIKRPRDVKDK